MSASQDDPLSLFHAWMGEAEKNEINDPNAMSLATVDGEGRPSVRMVLLKGADEAGFVFYTNLESRKGVELAANPFAALCFHWKSLRRQIRVEGRTQPVTDAEADSYFASRARTSQIGAWASIQSRPLNGRFELEKRIAEYTARFGIGAVPRPPHWSGFRLVPDRMEFWQDKPFRLHDRFIFTKEDGAWTRRHLFP
ncbi:pyridoxamine 5'-phosphate oxidase [Paramagnetospirillum kuznetsovii]|uniref:Pyridoxine/pyridoxamine 5'-phosphate oxidase n=1 Tax=Paramagnetospirillum kuznetsovii TaxID=2053833 RepID=A0A364P0U6_9PROT|nr:pyridoxamine 5'-phosphate oxidase [Paramagnetospirillum kuznetsovii]RAU22969.1 pyridoxamine 5'-phosphate oxidase [Paramagnetospirillum kuznetsovii]